MPAPNPETAESPSSTHRLSLKPISPSVTAVVARPASTIGRRPTESATLPENCRLDAVPAAATASATPATQVSSCTATANCGTTATRTPKLAQPLANAEARAARYAESRSPSPSRIGGAGVAVGSGRRLAPDSRTPTTSAATTSATAYATKGTRSPRPAIRPPRTGPSMPPMRKELA